METPDSFEAAMQALETLITLMESGELTLEESLKLYEEGQTLAVYCQETLEAATLRLTDLESNSMKE